MNDKLSSAGVRPEKRTEDRQLPKKVVATIHLIGFFVCAAISCYVAFNFYPGWIAAHIPPRRWVLIYSILGGFIGVISLQLLVVNPVRELRMKLENMPIDILVSGVIGLIAGLLIEALISVPLAFLPDVFKPAIPLITTAVFMYLGVRLAVHYRHYINHLLPPWFNDKQNATDQRLVQEKILVDTSVIIDGRIAEIVRSGFLLGTICIPTFILKELQSIADSEDGLKRQRGRRGLEILCKLQKEFGEKIEILNVPANDSLDTENRLIFLAKQQDCKILTNDYNLNRIANLQGVHILNVNDLANAVKSIIFPGETLQIQVIQEGKEYNQGVGYIEDGTMVVIEGGRQFLNQEISVIVTKILQTAVGRMIFARLE